MYYALRVSLRRNYDGPNNDEGRVVARCLANIREKANDNEISVVGNGGAELLTPVANASALAKGGHGFWRK